MKKLLILLSLLFCGVAIAETINITWHNTDGTTYETTTCNVDDTLALPTAPTKPGYTFLGWRNYIPIEYIESTGTQYIIVPYRVNNKTVFFCRYNITACGPEGSSAIFGVTDAPNAFIANFGILRLFCSYNRMGWGNNEYGSVINVNAPEGYNNWYEVLYDQNKLYQDGELYATSATSPDTPWVANYGLGIFARNGISVTMRSVAKISSVWAKEDGVYKLDLIPVLDPSGTPCMYDKVSDTFFYNQGTGDFIAGPVLGSE